jgi:hypothetical protein
MRIAFAFMLALVFSGLAFWGWAEAQIALVQTLSNGFYGLDNQAVSQGKVKSYTFSLPEKASYLFAGVLAREGDVYLEVKNSSNYVYPYSAGSSVIENAESGVYTVSVSGSGKYVVFWDYISAPYYANCLGVGGTCKPNICTSYDNCNDFSGGNCESGYCCFGGCTLKPYGPLGSKTNPIKLDKAVYCMGQNRYSWDGASYRDCYYAIAKNSKVYFEVDPFGYSGINYCFVTIGTKGYNNYYLAYSYLVVNKTTGQEIIAEFTGIGSEGSLHLSFWEGPYPYDYEIDDVKYVFAVENQGESAANFEVGWNGGGYYCKGACNPNTCDNYNDCKKDIDNCGCDKGYCCIGSCTEKSQGVLGSETNPIKLLEIPLGDGYYGYHRDVTNGYVIGVGSKVYFLVNPSNSLKGFKFNVMSNSNMLIGRIIRDKLSKEIIDQWPPYSTVTIGATFLNSGKWTFDKNEFLFSVENKEASMISPYIWVATWTW